ncbi:MAG: polysaccharide deacetylase family protein [Firmicutes bacterium]|nr:polysaccharide deacetylase family protein [Bacillota bacterium]
MYNGKKKAITFSYDDGVTQDIRLIDILDKYGLKCTFNLSSDLLGLSGSLIIEGVKVNHTKNKVDEIAEIYKNHEVAAHTLTHPCLLELTNDEVIRQVEEDRRVLEKISGKQVVGMAYPGGGTNFNKHIAELIKKNTEIKYARTIISSYNFDLQEDLFVFKPTVYHYADWDKMIELGAEFIQLKTETPKLLYIWGHSYEFDINNSWDKFEEFCEEISEKDDIFYGTNSEVLLC